MQIKHFVIIGLDIFLTPSHYQDQWWPSVVTQVCVFWDVNLTHWGYMIEDSSDETFAQKSQSS